MQGASRDPGEHSGGLQGLAARTRNTLRAKQAEVAAAQERGESPSEQQQLEMERLREKDQQLAEAGDGGRE